MHAYIYIIYTPVCTYIYFISELKFQLHCYVHFWTNNLGKGMNLLIFPAMG